MVSRLAKAMSIKLLRYDCTCISIYNTRSAFSWLPLLLVVVDVVRLFSLVDLPSPCPSSSSSSSLSSSSMLLLCDSFFSRFSALLGSFWCARPCSVVPRCVQFSQCSRTLKPSVSLAFVSRARAMSLQINMHVYFGFASYIFFYLAKSKTIRIFPIHRSFGNC